MVHITIVGRITIVGHITTTQVVDIYFTREHIVTQGDIFERGRIIVEQGDIIEGGQIGLAQLKIGIFKGSGIGEAGERVARLSTGSCVRFQGKPVIQEEHCH